MKYEILTQIFLMDPDVDLSSFKIRNKEQVWVTEILEHNEIGAKSSAMHEAKISEIRRTLQRETFQGCSEREYTAECQCFHWTFCLSN